MFHAGVSSNVILYNISSRSEDHWYYRHQYCISRNIFTHLLESKVESVKKEEVSKAASNIS